MEQPRDFNFKILIKPAILFVGLIAAFATWRLTPLKDVITLENIRSISEAARSFGPWAPVIYLLAYMIGAVLLVPASLFAVTGGLVFGVYWGTIYVTLGGTLGAAASFLISRYLARDLVERIVKTRPLFIKVDEGVKKQGWRTVLAVRTIPVFPFIFMNYALGLTQISFWTYILITFLGMLPVSFAFCLAAGSFVSGGGDWKITFLYLVAAGLLLNVMAFAPLLIKRLWGGKIADVMDEAEPTEPAVESELN